MKWYIPSWNGDLRLEPLESDPTKTVLKVEKPTAAEKEILARMGAEFLEHDWIDKWRKRWSDGVEIVLNAPIETVGPVAKTIMRPGNAVLTAITFADGNVATHSGPKEELEQVAKEAAEKGAESAASVKRPTPCCPECIPGSVAPAREVLLSFLSPEEHEMWAKSRSIVFSGGLSGHLYRLSHRHSREAVRNTRICRDLDLDKVLHFHDWSVPPEEEVLAAMLILKHREPWLRNEATLFAGSKDGDPMVFKNPFGGFEDGTVDSAFTSAFGAGYMASRRMQ